jgi:type I restriction enzyme S subunit
MVKGSSPTLKTPPGEYPLVVTAEFRRTSDTWQLEGPAVCIPLISSTGHGDAALHRVHYQEGKFALANLLVALLPNDPTICDAKYLYHLLMTRKDELLVPLMQGTANVSLKEQDIAGVNIQLPPLAYQQRVVVRIEELAAEIREARAIRHQASEETQVLLASMLERIFPENDNTRFQYQLVRDAIQGHKQGYYASGKLGDGDVKFARITDITDDAYLDYANMPRIAIDSASSESFRVQPNDFLFARTGGAGRFGLATENCDCVFASYLIRFTFKPDYSPEFLRYYLRSPRFQNRIKSRIHGGANQNVHAEDIKDATVPVLPLAEQRRIVAELDALQSRVCGMKRLQAETAAELDALLPAVLDRAFKGQLA